MDVFALRNQVVDDYAVYVRSFLRIADPEIMGFVERRLDDGRLWPDPLIQLNPSFAPGGTIDELVGQGVLHPECGRIFRRGKSETGARTGEQLLLHRHQRDAIDVAQSGASYVLTTGTGSGKSLAYFVPIVDHVLRQGSRRGIKAIVVYPMNALVNSQERELRNYLRHGYGPGHEPVTFASYTGQTEEDERLATAANAPDILLTNYVMLELLMTRTDPVDRRIVEQAEGMVEFLVLDEMHTYRGRQGADVAMLVRRVRERLGSPTMRRVGTSATVAGKGSREERQAEVAKVATKLFGVPVEPEHVIPETLRAAIERPAPSPEELRAAVLNETPYSESPDHARFVADPLAAWVEQNLGLRQDEQGRLERQEPLTLRQGAERLHAETEVPLERCEGRLKEVLLAGYRTTDPATARRVFAFRLHQFISRGDTVYSTLETGSERHFSMEGQIYVAGDRDRRFYPLAFCRECGQDYFVVDWDQQDGQLEPRRLSDTASDEERERQAGFLWFDTSGEYCLEPDHLPDGWFDTRKDGTPSLPKRNRARAPRPVAVGLDGAITPIEGDGPAATWFVRAPLAFCPACGHVWASTGRSDFPKLAELATEGRSTATTILSLAVVRALRDAASLPEGARKLLSFTDNRQDAALQAGHFNDFVQTSMVRGAVLAAVRAGGPDGLQHDTIAEQVMRQLNLPFAEYASNPEVVPAMRIATDRALREVLGYRVFHDLRRGWRVNAPNLEQTGLLRIDYLGLGDYCAMEEYWQGAHPVLAAAAPPTRQAVCQTVLDWFRRELAIKTTYLDPMHQDRIQQNSNSTLTGAWALDLDEQLDPATYGVIAPSRRRPFETYVTLTPMSRIGQYLAKPKTWNGAFDQRLPKDDRHELATALVQILVRGGYLEAVGTDRHGADHFQLKPETLGWLPGDGIAPDDPTRGERTAEAERQVNAFFQDFYTAVANGLGRRDTDDSSRALNLTGYEAREHTAQVPDELRKEREDRFRDGDLEVLYCSPTMELGVDIADLNAVHLRNVPPTPANYAQRSGRAGRSGQPALVLTYCTSMSPHDQYFFRRRRDMVGGSVNPPRIDLANEELIASHMRAVWLRETGQNLGRTLKTVLDLGKIDEGLPLLDEVSHGLQNPHARDRALARGRRLLDHLADDLAGQTWFKPGWVEQLLDSAPRQLDEACERWRQLYLSAVRQQQEQHRIMEDHSVSPERHKVAQRLRYEAEAQLTLLRDEGAFTSDFYSYRYVASEGFLPGYNFPRLPLTAYLPASRGPKRRLDRDEYVSRGRFIAISEFGPRNHIYYEGSRYQIEKVILPPRDAETDAITLTAKFCTRCGYGHLPPDHLAERCRQCEKLLDAGARYFPNLFRMQNVTTRRIDRITSDEEERLRLGYELMVAYRFAEREGGLDFRRAALVDGAETIAEVTYAPTATIWRLNLGWKRRKDKEIAGFLIDPISGEWARGEHERSAGEDEIAPVTGAAATPRASLRVVPFVEDRRNALLLTWCSGLSEPASVTLLTALKRGIEAHYQLEQSELGVELLPESDDRVRMLFYEAAEGGAGVLSRLVEEAESFEMVARAALAVCHIDPETGADRGAEEREEPCEAACYDCLLSYTNQPWHSVLDRSLLPEMLAPLRVARLEAGAGRRPRAEQREHLLAACESELERDFVRFLDEEGYRLPDRAQHRLSDFGTRPDFYVEKDLACIYVDGPYHEFPARRARDAEVTSSLEDGGYVVVRLTSRDRWRDEIARWPWIFGDGKGGR
ncbi:MAG: DEAD/DEAH box helicase [Thermomicrobiales bacterium]